MADRCAGTIPFLVREQDRVTGDWSPFWEARDYLGKTGRIRASVFVVHGLNDWNVKTKAFAEWWYRLARRGIPRKIWLHNGGHGVPGGPGAAAYKVSENRWFDHWLFGVQNGIMQQPRDDSARGRVVLGRAGLADPRRPRHDGGAHSAQRERARRAVIALLRTRLEEGAELRRPRARARH